MTSGGQCTPTVTRSFQDPVRESNPAIWERVPLSRQLTHRIGRLLPHILANSASPPHPRPLSHKGRGGAGGRPHALPYLLRAARVAAVAMMAAAVVPVEAARTRGPAEQGHRTHRGTQGQDDAFHGNSPQKSVAHYSEPWASLLFLVSRSFNFPRERISLLGLEALPRSAPSLGLRRPPERGAPASASRPESPERSGLPGH